MADAERRSHRVDLIATILLAVAAVATAWTTYQSTQWRGELTLHGARSTAARIESSTASTKGGQLTQVDIATFTQWVNATEAGNAPLADFYRQRFRAEFTASVRRVARDPPTHESRRARHSVRHARVPGR